MKSRIVFTWLIVIFLMCLLSARATQWLSKQQIESVPDLQDIEVPLASENPLEKANLAARKITNTDFMVEEAEENDTDGENGDWQDTLKESAESLKERGSKVLKHAQKKASEWTEKAKEKITSASEKLKERGEKVKEKSAGLKEDIKSRSEAYFSRASKYAADEEPTFWQRAADAGSSSLNEWYDRVMAEVHQALHPLRYFSDSSEPVATPSLAPGLEWRQSDLNYFLSIDLAGIPQEHLCITLVSPDRLEIHAGASMTTKKTMKKKLSTDTDMFFYADRQIDRSVRLPSDIQPDLISAHYKDGLLVVKLPKAVARPKNITIETLL